MPASVSVLLATYRPRWLGDAIESVIAQTFENWELLVVDDDPRPEIRRMIDNYGDARIAYLPNTRRLGPAGSHARGLEAARYDLISIINHDDVWEPVLLERLVEGIVNYHAVAAFADHWVIDGNGEINEQESDNFTRRWGRYGLQAGLHRDVWRLAVERKAIPVAQATVFSRYALNGIPRLTGGAYDFFIATRLAETGLPVFYVPQRLARFRIHDQNLGRRRSPVNDLGVAAIYGHVARSNAPPEVRSFAFRQMIRGLSLMPRSAIRQAQSRLPGHRPRDSRG